MSKPRGLRPNPGQLNESESYDLPRETSRRDDPPTIIRIASGKKPEVLPPSRKSRIPISVHSPDKQSRTQRPVDRYMRGTVEPPESNFATPAFGTLVHQPPMYHYPSYYAGADMPRYYTGPHPGGMPSPVPAPVTKDTSNNEEMEKIIRDVLKARQSDQETIQKTVLDAALRGVTAAVRDMQDKTNLDIEREKVKATMFARDTAEREERKRKEIHDQARQEVETEFALKAAMHENMMQKIREELRQEQERKAVEETERKAKVREMMQQEAIRLRSLYGFEARASPQPPWEYHTPHVRPYSQHGAPISVMDYLVVDPALGESRPRPSTSRQHRKHRSHALTLESSEDESEPASLVPDPHEAWQRDVPPYAPSVPLSSGGYSHSWQASPPGRTSAERSFIRSRGRSNEQERPATILLDQIETDGLHLNGTTRKGTDTLEDQQNLKEDSEGDEDSDFYTSARASPIQPDDTAEERWNNAEKGQSAKEECRHNIANDWTKKPVFPDDSGGDDRGNIDWPTMPQFGHEGPTISNGPKEEIEQQNLFSLPNHQGILPILPHSHQIDLKTALADDLRQAQVQQRPGKSKKMFPSNGVAVPVSPMIQLSDDYPYTSNDGNKDCQFAEGFRRSTSPVRYPYLPKPSELSLGGQSFGSLQQKQPSTTHVPMVPMVFWAMTPVRFEFRSTSPPVPRPQGQAEGPNPPSPNS
ncbi:hypothetical protein CDEST_01639 [Colletotrichum destructivum]|uniref:Reticulocyte-binding protein 2-like protein a n=1 Tax=Colletotrichum destructivum TaxID=34406 RepID=A0AAX4I0B0_9PEZI|nr:hypothetical protein CDEST_01639 [Colletotrichum destructivum]